MTPHRYPGASTWNCEYVALQDKKENMIKYAEMRVSWIIQVSLI